MSARGSGIGAARQKNAEALGLECDSLLATEREARWSVGIDERHSRFVLERDFSRWLFEDRSATSTPVSAAAPEVVTVFKGDVLAPTVVKKTEPLALLEAKLRALERGAVSSLEVRLATGEVVGRDVPDAADFSHESARRSSVRSRTHGLLPAAPDNGDLPSGKGYKLRILERRERSLREDTCNEESEDFRRIRAQCGRGMLGIIGAITALPNEMRQLAMLRLHDDERQAFMLRPTLLAEHTGRSLISFEEREELYRYAIMKNEDSLIHNIIGRFHSVRASITSFLRAQWLVRSLSTRNYELRSKFFINWKHYASSTQRLRRIVLGLSRIRNNSERQLLRRYTACWNHPIQQHSAAADVSELMGVEFELREHMELYEDECRSRSCAEVLESVLFGRIIDEHFAVIGPLIEARRSTAALELEMLNAARLAKVRLQTWYFWTVDRRNDAKVAFLREKVMFYSAQTRFMTWHMWCERRFVTRETIDAKLLGQVEMEEDVGRLVREARLTAKHAMLLARASSVNRRCDQQRVLRQLSSIAKSAEKSSWRRYFERWLMFTSRNNSEARALFLSRFTQHLVTMRYYLLWSEMREGRRGLLEEALTVDTFDRALIVAEADEAYDRIQLQRDSFVGFLRLGRLVRRVQRVADNSRVLGTCSFVTVGAASSEDAIPPEHTNDCGADEPSLAGVADVEGSFGRSDSESSLAAVRSAAVPLPSAVSGLRPLPTLNPLGFTALHMRMRFHTLRVFAHRKATYANGLAVTYARRMQVVGGSAWSQWRLFTLFRSEARARAAVAVNESSTFFALHRSIQTTIVETIADAKLRAALQLAAANELRAMAGPFGRLTALVQRRRAARLKRPEALALQRKGEVLLIARYMHHWRRMVTIARTKALAIKLSEVNRLIVLRKFWDRFPPNLIRLAKVSKVRQELDAAKAAAAELEEGARPGPPKGSSLANRLLLKRQPSHAL